MASDRANSLTDKCILMSQPMKSGSTLVSRMLNAHPLVGMTYDSVNFFRFCYHRYDPITDMENVRRLFDDMAYRLYHRFEIELDTAECLAHMGESNLSYGQAYLSIIRTMLTGSGKTIVGDKEPLAWTRIPDFLRMCPNGKAIITVRDPRDVLISFKAMTTAPGNDYLIALFNVIDAVNHAIRLRAQYPERVYMIEFSRLKVDTEAVLRDLCNFLEIDFAPQILEEDSYTDMAGNAWDPRETMSFKEETGWLTPVARWKRNIDEEDLYLAEWIAKEQIGQLGLDFSGKVHSQEVFNKAVEKITSSDLLKEAFKRWCDLREGMERFPTDPLDPINWDPDLVKHPEAFKPTAAPSSSR